MEEWSGDGVGVVGAEERWLSKEGLVVVQLFYPVNPQSKKSYWRFSKNDFFPEPSFQSLSTYKSALSQTHLRLKDRILGRSSDATELLTLQKQSEYPLKLCLTWWDLIWIAFGSVVDSGIFAITVLRTSS